MAQAFEGALVALQRVAEQRAVDYADEVARHRCVRRVHTRSSRSPCRPVATPRRAAARPHAASAGVARRASSDGHGRRLARAAPGC